MVRQLRTTSSSPRTMTAELDRRMPKAARAVNTPAAMTPPSFAWLAESTPMAITTLKVKPAAVRTHVEWSPNDGCVHACERPRRTRPRTVVCSTATDMRKGCQCHQTLTALTCMNPVDLRGRHPFSDVYSADLRFRQPQSSRHWRVVAPLSRPPRIRATNRRETAIRRSCGGQERTRECGRWSRRS